MSENHSRDAFPEGGSGRMEPPGAPVIPTEKAVGLTGASALSLVLGVLSLVWVLLDARPFLAWLFATIGIITGLRIFLPRVTTLDKVLITVGVLASVVAIVLLLLDLAS
jgi:hypothetical protein